MSQALRTHLGLLSSTKILGVSRLSAFSLPFISCYDDLENVKTFSVLLRCHESFCEVHPFKDIFFAIGQTNVNKVTDLAGL